MFSIPPATAASMLPSAISCAAETIACAPDPQTRLTVSAGMVTGRPACTAACRAGFILLPACTTLPITTVSTSCGPSFARATAALIATAPRSGAGTSLRLPPKVPTAVRIGSAKTTERCDVMANLLCVTCRALRHRERPLSHLLLSHLSLLADCCQFVRVAARCRSRTCERPPGGLAARRFPDDRDAEPLRVGLDIGPCVFGASQSLQKHANS